MIQGRYLRLRKRTRGQAMVEFVIALPILLFVLFGIIEFGRMVFAWMAVQNAARFGIRYAVTGEFKEIYCIEAGNLLGAAHVSADTDGGDPQDCKIPNSYTGMDKDDKERELIDLARLFSIRDVAVGGGTGLWLRPAISGNYEQYLDLHDETFIGLPDETGFYHVTICSNRSGQYIMDYGNYAIPLCRDVINDNLMDDAGGPGDRVKVHVEHRHPLFLPLLTNIWPAVNLSAERDGIVEKFRTSRSLGVSGPILSAPTWTQTPTVTQTPTITDTPTNTPTQPPTATPIPVDCDLIEIDHSLSTIGALGGGFIGAKVYVKNNNPVPIHLFRAEVGWDKIPNSRYLYSMEFNSSAWVILNDMDPPSVWVPAVPVEMAENNGGYYIALMKPVAEPLQGETSVDLEFEDNCHKGISVNLPTSTITLTPTITDTPTATPTPDCSKYSMSDFVFDSWAIQWLTVTNNDVVDANVSAIHLNWNFPEQYGVINGYPNLNIDWFRWNGTYFHLGVNADGVQDYSSPTDWSGSLPFKSGSSYVWEIDFDGDWGGGGPLSGIVSDDFGVTIDFDNGCQLQRNPVPRPIISWTPSLTPTRTFTPTPPPPPTATPLPTITPLPTNTLPPSKTPTASNTPSITPTPTDTPVPTATPLPTNTLTPTNTPDWDATATASSPTPVHTNTPVPTATEVPSPTPTWFAE